MNKVNFIFIATFFILLAVLSSGIKLSLQDQLIASSLFIAVFGISHGAIDHILHSDSVKHIPVGFYLKYFGFMAIYILIWFLSPLVSFILFLILSAFHFGESQFAHYTSLSKNNRLIINISWGTALIASLLFLKMNEIDILANSYSDIGSLSLIVNFKWLPYLYGTSVVVVIITLFYSVYLKQITYDKAFFELYLLSLINVSFFILPLIIAFAMYFVILHSLKVLLEEFDYLNEKDIIATAFDFIKLLFPYTTLSILGGAIVYLFLLFINIKISLPLLLFAGISVLTLPHSIVMNGFYKKLFNYK